jgi:5-methyltetrahydropteroyltriglutamate--homocysteine methyltransferase
VAEHVIRPNAAAVVEAGCDWIQIDEPALTTRPDEVKFGVEAFNKSVEGIPSQRRSLHVCFSDYSLLYPHVLELDDCFALQLEFAQRDSRETGTSREERPGYEPLDHFKEHGGPDVGLGVLDIHSDFIETPELVRDRVIYAAELLGPERVQVNPDCGLRTRSWDVAFEKLRNMVEGTRLAEEALNRAHAGAR